MLHLSIVLQIMHHLLSIDNLTSQNVFELIHKAQQFKHSGAPAIKKASSVASLFFENSTRTHLSFTLAAQRLGVFLTPLSLQQSSVQKGETLLDTMLTLHALGIKTMIIRHPTSQVFMPLLPALPSSLRIINAGDGQNEHPTQALLDFMTLVEQRPRFNDLKITIVGDIRHSRVAHSFQKLCALLNIPRLTLVAPPIWSPKSIIWGHLTHDLAEGIQNADVVMSLRVQQERLGNDEQMNLETYSQLYGLTPQVLQFAHPSALVMHPGPMNRGVEMSSEVADGPQSLVLKQVENGVWMRMAILESIITAEQI